MSVTISHITDNSIAYKIKLEKGDILISINENPIRDVIDYMYYSKEEVLNLKIQRGDRIHSFKIKKEEGEDLGLELKHFRIKSCRNKCIFCFVDQLPKGMRKTLYLKDEDYRMSFLYGNYITLTNLSAADKKRIISQRLSPLYVSVHTANNELRKSILGSHKTPDIITEMQELATNKIKIHAQIVLCPGVNDGNELIKTIKTLYRLYPYVASIAVVPAGVTRYRKTDIKPLEKADAAKVIETTNQLKKRFKRRHGDPIVYASDEFYIKADVPFPSLNEYGDLPQIENGVGLIPAFLNSMKKLKLPKRIDGKKKVVTFTGVSFAPYLEEVSQKLNSIEGLSFEVFKIENKFFGPNITVTGLLTGKDILRALMGRTKAECLLVPCVTLKDRRDIFLDNVTLRDMEESLGMQVRVIEPTPEGLLRGITSGCEREN